MAVIWEADVEKYDLNCESLGQKIVSLSSSFSSRAGFFNLDIIDIWVWVSLCVCVRGQSCAL